MSGRRPDRSGNQVVRQAPAVTADCQAGYQAECPEECPEVGLVVCVVLEELVEELRLRHLVRPSWTGP